MMSNYRYDDPLNTGEVFMSIAQIKGWGFQFHINCNHVESFLWLTPDQLRAVVDLLSAALDEPLKAPLYTEDERERYILAHKRAGKD